MDERQKRLNEKYGKVMELYRSNEIRKTNEHLKELLSMAREAEDHYYYALGLNFTGALQTAMGNASHAIDYYFEAMIYAEKYNVLEILPVIYNNIGARYMDASSYETALIYLKKGEEIFRSLKDSDKVDLSVQRDRKIVNCVNLALTYTYLKEYENSNIYVDQAEKLVEGIRTQDMDFTIIFLRCLNQYYLGNISYVKENLDSLLEGVENLESLYSYEHNIIDMFDFLIQLEEREKLQRLLYTLEAFAEKHPDAECRLLACKLRSEYEEKYGTRESYQESCVALVQQYKNKEQQTMEERKEYVTLRLEMQLTEVKQKKLLKDALKEAEKANAAKSEFLSRMSHEIRTPLNAIIGYTAMSQDCLDAPDKLKDYQEKSQVAARHLLSLINDVLDISAIASGHFKVDYTEFDLKKIITEINSIFHQQALNKNIQFLIMLKNMKEEKLIGDPLRIKQILLNLLSNAIKFTPEEGSITLLIEQKEAESDQPLSNLALGEQMALTGTGNSRKIQMEFQVKDSGIGMTKEFLNRMFVPFEQQDASITRKYGGTGLGLSISQQLTEMMGGSIRVSSEEQVGTSFQVTIPFETAASEEEEKAWENFAGSRVMMVTGDSCLREETKRFLRTKKIRADFAQEGMRALRQIEIRKGGDYEYDLYFVDYALKDMDGIRLAKEIYNQMGKKAYIVLLTDYSTTQMQQEARAAGFEHIIEKPLFPSAELELFQEKNGFRQKERTEKRQKTDFSGMHVLLAEDNEMNMEIAKNILSRANFVVEEAANGKIALERFLHAEPGTYQVILMDIQMPEMDGYEAAKAIRNSGYPGASDIPIIALTANAFQEDVRKALESGMNGHIAKPVNISELYKEMETVIRQP